MKLCTNPDCSIGKPQPLDQFYRHQRLGLTPRCKTCTKAAVAAYRQTDAGRAVVQRTQAKYRATDADRAYKREWARVHYKPRERRPVSLRIPVAERFWSHVDKSDDCWLWTASCDGKGYGHISLGRRGEGRVRTHRFSWELHNGPIPPGMCVLHCCDVPRCVNPDHLFLGSIWDNMQDKTKKGRARGGNGWATSKRKRVNGT